MFQCINTAKTFKKISAYFIRLLQHVMRITASRTTPSYCCIMRSRNLKIKTLHCGYCIHHWTVPLALSTREAQRERDEDPGTRYHPQTAPRMHPRCSLTLCTGRSSGQASSSLETSPLLFFSFFRDSSPRPLESVQSQDRAASGSASPPVPACPSLPLLPHHKLDTPNLI